MKNNFLLYLICFLSLIGCDSKSERETKLDCLDFGELEYYSPFLWVKKDTAYVEKRIAFSFNDYCKEQAVEVSFDVIDEDGNQLSDSYVKLYVNDSYCPQNQFMLSAEDLGDNEVVKVGLKILPNGEQGKHYAFLNITNHNLDRVGDFDLDQDSRVLAVRYDYNEIYNPLAFTLFILLMAFLAFLILWFLILRNLVYPKMKKGKVTINAPYFKSIKYKGARKVVFTNNKYSQSGFDKLFKGRILYNQNPVWTEDYILLPGNKKDIKYKLPLEYEISNQDPASNDFLSSLKKFSNYTIVTDENIKIEFTIN